MIGKSMVGIFIITEIIKKSFLSRDISAFIEYNTASIFTFIKHPVHFQTESGILNSPIKFILCTVTIAQTFKSLPLFSSN